jgi:hypothetical protein
MGSTQIEISDKNLCTNIISSTGFNAVKASGTSPFFNAGLYPDPTILLSKGIGYSQNSFAPLYNEIDCLRGDTGFNILFSGMGTSKQTWPASANTPYIMHSNIANIRDGYDVEGISFVESSDFDGNFMRMFHGFDSSITGLPMKPFFGAVSNSLTGPQPAPGPVIPVYSISPIVFVNGATSQFSMSSTSNTVSMTGPVGSTGMVGSGWSGATPTGFFNVYINNVKYKMPLYAP